MIVDLGFSAGDLSFDVTLPDKDGALYEKTRHVLQSYDRAVLNCRNGCFIVLLSALNYKKGKTSFTAEPIEDIS